MTTVTVSETPPEETGGVVLLDPKALSVAPAALAPLDVVEPVTLEEAKEHLRVHIPDDDGYISSLIVAARTMAEGKLNRTIVQRRRAVRFSGWGVHMRFPKPPVISIDRVGYYDETGGELLLDPALYYLAGEYDEDGVPYVAFRPGEPYPALDRRAEPITVYYTAGYAPGEVPASIVQWIKLAIGTMYNNRETVVNGVASNALGDDFARWLLQPHQVYE